MPRNNEEPTVRVHLWIYESDHEKLKVWFGDTVGVSQSVRKVIRTFVKQVESQEAAAQASAPAHV